jgi:hypothetical protein
MVVHRVQQKRRRDVSKHCTDPCAANRPTTPRATNNLRITAGHQQCPQTNNIASFAILPKCPAYHYFSLTIFFSIACASSNSDFACNEWRPSDVKQRREYHHPSSNIIIIMMIIIIIKHQNIVGHLFADIGVVEDVRVAAIRKATA